MLLWAGLATAQEQVTVFAASSLQGSLDALAAAYTIRTETDVALVFAASSTIARQVRDGAPADAVIFADLDWSDWLQAETDLSPAVFVATNALVVFAHPDAPQIDNLAALPSVLDRPLALAEIETVPAGRYGREALEAIGLWGDLAPHVVQASNVRAALRFVEQGEAWFGIGYGSDATALPGLVPVHVFASDTHRLIVYPAMSSTPDGAAFVDFILSDEGQRILQDWGFGPVGGVE